MVFESFLLEYGWHMGGVGWGEVVVPRCHRISVKWVSKN